jgi:hypothetical protein
MRNFGLNPPDETVFEVEVEGAVHRRTFRQALAWGEFTIRLAGAEVAGPGVTFHVRHLSF